MASESQLGVDKHAEKFALRRRLAFFSSHVQRYSQIAPASVTERDEHCLGWVNLNALLFKILSYLSDSQLDFLHTIFV